MCRKISFFPFLNKPYLTFMISSLESEDYKCKNMNSLSFEDFFVYWVNISLISMPLLLMAVVAVESKPSARLLYPAWLSFFRH